jgi:hypothetical protein
MSLGVGNIIAQQKKELTPGPPFALTAANNGLSVDPVSFRIVLGQAFGAVGNPAILLSNREIPMGGFAFQFHNFGFRKFLIDNANKLYEFGDIDGDAFGSTFIIDDGNRRFLMNDTAGGYFTIDVANGQAAMNPGSYIGLQMDDNNGTFILGDVFATSNNTFISVDDVNQVINLTKGSKPLLTIDLANKFSALGDDGGQYVGSEIFVDNFSTAQAAIRMYLPVNGSTPATRVVDLRSNNTYSIGDLQTKNNGTQININDNLANQQVTVQALNGLKITGDTTLIRTGTALSNNAGISIGTLTNAPSAGDPTKWIAINDNGTIRKIPTWL